MLRVLLLSALILCAVASNCDLSPSDNQCQLQGTYTSPGRDYLVVPTFDVDPFFYSRVATWLLRFYPAERSTDSKDLSRGHTDGDEQTPLLYGDVYQEYNIITDEGNCHIRSSRGTYQLGNYNEEDLCGISVNFESRCERIEGPAKICDPLAEQLNCGEGFYSGTLPLTFLNIGQQTFCESFTYGGRNDWLFSYSAAACIVPSFAMLCLVSFLLTSM